MSESEDPRRPERTEPGPPSPSPAQRGSIFTGLWLVVAGHFASSLALTALGALAGSTEFGMLWLMVIGAAQSTYVLPLAIWFHRRGDKCTVTGVWIAAGITALLNAACFGVVMTSLRGL